MAGADVGGGNSNGCIGGRRRSGLCSRCGGAAATQPRRMGIRVDAAKVAAAGAGSNALSVRDAGSVATFTRISHAFGY